MFGGKVPNNGLNVYGGVYQICLYAHIAEARTCVPASSESQIKAIGALCNTRGPTCSGTIAGEEPRCIATSMNPDIWQQSRLGHTVSAAWFNASNGNGWVPPP
jgi:hypothetical protein